MNINSDIKTLVLHTHDERMEHYNIKVREKSLTQCSPNNQNKTTSQLEEYIARV